jgi:hypothetical protein
MFGLKIVTEKILEEKLLELMHKMRKELREEVGVNYIDGFSPFIRPSTIIEKHDQLREEFEELDGKVDKMEKYLGVEYVELQGNISHDEYAESVDTKEYRKLQTFKSKKK